MKFLLTLFVCLVVLLACAPPARAQTYSLKIYAAGAIAPQQTYNLTGVVCGQTAPPASASNVNPTKVVWTDPSNPALVCQFVQTSTDPIFSRPIGSYEGTLTLTTDAGTSPESARAPFFVKAPPGVLTGLRFTQ